MDIANKSETRPYGFQKGKSGNPSGRPKKEKEELDLIAACRAKVPDALRVIESIMNDGQNERNRITAAVHIIERAYGKAVQPTDNLHSGAIDSHIELIIVDGRAD